MKKPEITSGEWKIIGKGFDGLEIGVLPKQGMGFYHTATAFNVDNDEKANAQAISAVPEMIDALIVTRSVLSKAAKNNCTCGRVNVCSYHNGIENIDRALKKAGCTE